MSAAATRDGVSRLCVVTPMHSTTHTGGAEYQIDCLIDQLSSVRRHEIYYLSGLVDGAGRHYQLVRVGNASSAPRFGYLTQALPLYQALSKIRPDAIYQRVACGYTGVCAYYARRNDSRMIWHVAHDSDVTPGMSLDGRNPVRRFLEKRSVEYGIRRANCVVTQTNDQATLLERHYGRRPDAIIPNFHPRPREKLDKSGELTVAWVASLKPWKRPEAFLDLADQLADLRQVRFVMVGGTGTGAGEQDWAAALQGRIAATPNVQFLGGRSQAQVNELLARSHVFVNTSRYEGFPNTFIQAWMREVPVVSLHVNPDQLLEEQSIGIFCAGSQANLLAAVRSLLTDTALRERYAQKARDYAFSRHSMDNATELAQLIDGCGSDACGAIT